MKRQSILILAAAFLLLGLVSTHVIRGLQKGTEAARGKLVGDSNEAVKLGFGYERRGDHIHFTGNGATTGTGADATRIDRPSRRIVRGFNRVNNKVSTKPLKPCTSLDANSFEPLSEEYSRDKNMVYYKMISPGVFIVVELPKADVKTFEVIGFNLARDKNHVWYYGAVIPGIDPATVEVVNDSFAVLKDANGVWYQRKQIIGADAKTFRHVGSGYYADAKHAYWCTDPIERADLASFRVLGDSFVAADRNMVYRSGQQMPGIDPKTCKFIMHDPYGYQVISDKNGVYLNSLKFLHADPKTFKMVGNRNARSGKYFFLIDTYHCTPVTLYKEEGQLIAETVLYDNKTKEPLATIRAEVAGDTLMNLKLSPPPGKNAARPAPDWQIKNFQRPDVIKRMEDVRRLLK